MSAERVESDGVPSGSSRGQPLPRVLEGVILQEQQGACFLMDTASGEVYSVNATAARIFSLCQSGETLEGAVRSLTAGLSPPPPEGLVLEDVRRTVRQLQELGLCEPALQG